MDWMYVAPEDSASHLGQHQLGFCIGDKYKIAADAKCTLLRMCAKLEAEDKSLRTFRRKLGFSQIAHKDLAPIIVESTTEESWEVFSATVNLLVDLTTPLECLFACPDVERSDEGAQTIFELKQHLSDLKNIFLDPRVSKSILLHIERIVNKSHQDASERQCVVACVTLLRNILHIPEMRPNVPNSNNTDTNTTESPISTNGDGDANSGDGETPLEEDAYGVGETNLASAKNNSGSNNIRRQHQILWNLFAHNLDSVIMSLIESLDFKMWSTPLVQLIALVYKDQHVSTLERLLNLWLESSLSESSEDNESNTTPHNHQDGNGCCSSSVLTSTEPNSTDDSSDGNGHGSGNHSDKGTCGSTGEASSPESLNETNGADVEPKNVSPKKPSSPTRDLESSSRQSTPTNSTKAYFDAVTFVIASDVEMRSDVSSDSCKEPPKKRAAMEGHHLRQASATETASTSFKRKKVLDTDSGMSSTPMTPLTGKEGSDSSMTPQSHALTVKLNMISKEQSKDSDSVSSKKAVSTCSTKAIKGNSETSSSASSHCDLKDSQDMDSGCKNDKKESSEEGYGYVSAQANLKSKTQVTSEQQESNSTSSNDEDMGRKRNVTPHTNLQKPRPKKKVISAAEKRELRRKKLIERSKSKRLKVKALVHHVPTDEDIADLLKEFTVDFLLKGYSSLVTDLRLQLMSDENPDIDKSHFLWLITYFLKFASQLEVELEQIGPVLSVETVAYLTYEGVRFFEELELAVREQRERAVDLRPHLRRIHLVVTALREFIQTLQTYAKFSHFADEDKEKLRKIQLAVCGMRDLRQLFLLLIRRYNSSLQMRQYLNDVICGNHALLVMIENTKMDVDIMTAHLQQFATVEVMRQYGQLLETFDTNSEAVNDCVFTMMHHVSGDLKTPETLFIPQVLETFSDIWERLSEKNDDVEICEDWADLIEYVIQKFLSTIGLRPHAFASNLLECINNSEAVDENGFTRSQLDNLYQYYTQFEDAPDPVGCVIEMYKRNSNVTKTRLAVIQALLSQGIISLAQYMNMMYMKSVLTTHKTEHEGSVVVEVGSERCDSEGHDTDIENAHDLNAQNKDQIETLKELLKKQGKACLLTWLQQTLLDACCVKINCNGLFKSDGESLEPVPYHFNFINQSIPMVAWNKNQESGLQTETFMLLLHKLGFHLATDVGKCFPRIPHFWSADHLYNLALKVGPLRKDELKMDLSFLETASALQNTFCSTKEPPKASCSSYDEGINTGTSSSLLSPTTKVFSSGGSETDGGVSSVPEFTPFAIPTPTNSWIQVALTSKRSILMSSPPDGKPKGGLTSDLNDRGDVTSSSMEKMQISDDSDQVN